MWYASPDAPCWTAIARGPLCRFLNATADLSSWLHVFGTFTSLVLTTSAMFSTEIGMPYSFLAEGPYENASSVAAGNCAGTVFFSVSGTATPLPASAADHAFA